MKQWQFVLLVLILPNAAFTYVNDRCACVKISSGTECALAPGHGQKAVIVEKISPGGGCDLDHCKKLYDKHRALSSKTFHPISCEDFVIEPDNVEDAISCDPKKRTMMLLSLTPEFDSESSVKVPAPYHPLRFDINKCDIGRIGQTVNSYLAALKRKNCSCDGILININSHGDGTKGEKHLTICRDTSGSKQQNIELNSRDLLLQIQSQLKANGCRNAVTALDNCFSSKVIENLRADDLSYPVLTSAHSKCVAPGNSNLWTDYQKWCQRCDGNLDGVVTIKELKSCIAGGKPEFFKLPHWEHTMSIVTGPWAMSFSKNSNEADPVLYCAEYPTPADRKGGPGYYQGLQGRDRINQESETHPK